MLAPAGSLDTLKTAFGLRADAVHFGGQEFGMRSAPKNFTHRRRRGGSLYAHERSGRVFVTCNILPRSSEVTAMESIHGAVGEIGVDALIVTDIGGADGCAEGRAEYGDSHLYPWRCDELFGAQCAGNNCSATRVVLARELSLADIRELRAHTPA